MKEIRTLDIVGTDAVKTNKTGNLVKKIYNKKCAVYADMTKNGIHQIIASNQGSPVKVALNHYQYDMGPEYDEIENWEFLNFSQFYWDRDDLGNAYRKQYAILQETSEGWKLVFDKKKSLFANSNIATDFRYWNEKFTRACINSTNEDIEWLDNRKLTGQIIDNRNN